ncbi:polysaccharide lyase family 7 protein [Melanomma pulvis-pyrius CBS 109.77]|uniref:Polysaccharide lyase family 7 protein n=1 Tax=Melanomma pulvis-pyrius CBS 109.77 TaxID=1314802 RepID=A0A6A6XV57_9PLEO|nr:polysaccharide lyase family 7 protein [Melanomma pulvis-pyrius CBS 109.77]
MSPIVSSTIFLLLGTALAVPFTPNTFQARSLNPTCAPGGNFNLANWKLQLPTGTPGKMDSVSGSKLKGCSGWKDSDHFFTSKTDGSLVMQVPGSKESSGCVTSPNSKHCRTELRESNPNSWSPKSAVNRLKVKLSVPKADDSKYGTVIGQIHVDDSVSTKPVCELFINKSGQITMGVEQIPNTSSLKMTKIQSVAPNATFTYEIRYEQSKLKVAINGGDFKTLSTGSLKAPLSYFKVGNYNQGDSPSKVQFYSIDVQHS